MLRQCGASFRDERAFVRVDRVERELLDPVHRGVQPDRADDVRSARLEPRRRIEERRFLERHLLDHRAAALPRRKRLRAARRGPTGSRSRSGRRACARRKRRNRRRSRRRRPAGAAPPGSRRAAAARLCRARSRPRAWRRGSSPSTFDTWAKATTRCSSVSIASAASRSMRPSSRQRHRVDFVAGELPRDDVAVMLELRQQDAVAAIPREACARRG